MSTKNRAAVSSHGRGATDATVESQYMYHHSNYFGGGFEDVKSPSNLLSSFFKAILATALFRCWRILAFFLAWATAVSLINHHGTSFTIQPTLLTVIGTVIGFVISYRTTASFERYNEGRRYWSQIVLTSRTLARAVWFQVPDVSPTSNIDAGSKEDEEMRARTLIEKKTVINLIQAFSVAVKHYLRGEEGIDYEDLYHFVKFLPSYVFPAGIISPGDSGEPTVSSEHISSRSHLNGGPHYGDNLTIDNANDVGVGSQFHGHDVEAQTTGMKLSYSAPVKGPGSHDGPADFRATLSGRASLTSPPKGKSGTMKFANDEHIVLKPASMPPKFSVYGIFPLSLLGRRSGTDSRAARWKNRYQTNPAITTENVPLEIATYLFAYVAALQRRKVLDVPTTNLLITSVNQFQDALTGLERIITTPIPFSYSMHLWLVTIIYCLALIWSTLKFLTIPATGIVTFVLFGFLVAGAEIENPFGYDLNDLNMDHFTHIIRTELHDLTTFPSPVPLDWVFSPENDHIFFAGRSSKHSPVDWVERGADSIKRALSTR